MAAAVDLLADLIRIPSLSHHEGPAADLVEARLREESGLEVGRLEDNVWASLGDGDDVLLLNSHLDVVPASADHPYPPFEPTLRGDDLFARGASDDKGQTYILIKAVEGLLKTNGRLPVNVKFLVEGEEEVEPRHPRGERQQHERGEHHQRRPADDPAARATQGRPPARRSRAAGR